MNFPFDMIESGNIPMLYGISFKDFNLFHYKELNLCCRLSLIIQIINIGEIQWLNEIFQKIII